MSKYDSLKLENQLCFPLYAASKEIIKQYKPFLDKLDLTYTQYIAMMLLWDMKSLTVKEMGEELYLDSGTLSPLLKKLEQKGYIEKSRSQTDERVINVTITQKGEKLKNDALTVPAQMAKCTRISSDEAAVLYKILYTILGKEV